LAIRFVVDSAADVPEDIARALGVAVVPLSIHFGNRTFKDGVDLSPEAFLRELRTSAIPPSTSQPSPGEFLTAYETHSEPGDTLFSFHLSSKLSGTYQSAKLASRQLSDRQIHVIDTGLASLGIGLPAIIGARWAAKGASAEEIRAKSERLIAGTRIFFLVDSLEHLARHGRIGRAQALVGSMLSIKPVLCIDDGMVGAADRLRGLPRALERLVELTLTDVKEDQSYICAILDADQSELADEIETRVRQRIPSVEIIRAPFGATISTHAGPGTVGTVFARLS
jgi:DegV family protein with EDD domain